MRTLDYTTEDLCRAPRLRIALVTETWAPEVNGVAMTLGRMVDGLVRRGHGVQLIRPRQRPGETALHGSITTRSSKNAAVALCYPELAASLALLFDASNARTHDSF